MQNNIAVYNTVTSKCYAVRTCMPDPEHEHGGCTRQHRPGCQTFVPNIETGWKAYFRREQVGMANVVLVRLHPKLD